MGSVENVTSPTRPQNSPCKSSKDRIKEEEGDDSLHSYHMWLKEKDERLRKEKGKKLPDDEEDSNEENFRVDAMLERGPSPPESDNTSSYEWSYEEQFKQLYELDDEPERKTFLDEYFDFMKARGTPVSRIPIMAKQILDLYQLYNLVVKHGGLVLVIRNKQWSKITKGLNLPTSITSAAFTLRTQYLKYLYPYECAIHNFSTPKELQAAIDSNRRDRFSTLYHTEPSMTATRDERYSFALNGCEYPGTQPRHHMPHPPLGPSQLDMRYGLKRPSDAMMSKPYGIDNPKVIVLHDGTTSMADKRSGKVSPPQYHGRQRSPIRENDMRTIAEIEARRRSHHLPYGNGKDWDGDVRIVMEGEVRRRMIEDTRPTSNGMSCKDKNCNGIDCHYGASDIHRANRVHDPIAMCSCAYCKEYSSRRPYSPTRREMERHHMDGATANNHDSSSRLNGNDSTPPRYEDHYNGVPQHRRYENNGLDSAPTTTLKLKLPDIRKGGDVIHIMLEVEGVVYEGSIKAKASFPNQNGSNHNLSNGGSYNNNNNNNCNGHTTSSGDGDDRLNECENNNNDL